MTFVSKAYAQLNASQFGVDDSLGNITDFKSAFFWVINLIRYLGWLGVIFGVAYTLAIVVYKLWSAEDESSAFEIIAAAIKKNIIIIFLGMLIISSGFIANVVGSFFGKPDIFNIPN